ncbi:hypothetical protein LOTGIDRAFT_105112 [Lottia gigantea]|uniref:Protocadherin-16 n=1 Tax=Lottia gigantea TaxID=225164 RepID=V4AB09_LOTGI|nr:hypothetical protein LOTGIDRAFT_105112 [Lottia gigantea]ESO93972.1 hypothetical protein LOTGIDRAFT_105112 [Lottia gigantea]
MEASFHLVESEPPETIVGNIASKINIARGLSKSEFNSLRYSFLNPNDDSIASLFNINPENSDVSTVEKIDREKVCEFTSECVITFDIKISSLVTSFFEIVTVKIIIDDLNDNPPKFPELEITVFIPENVNPGSTYRINGATDLDRGQNNSVQLYEMVSSANLFDLKVDKKLDGTSDLRIVVKNVIDREKKHYYRFFIVAKDGGRPPLSGNVTVNVNITDENDNSPEFTEEIYDVSVTENTPIYSVIAKIHAIDRDSDSNGKVSYRFSTLKNPDIEKLFALNPLSGDITVKNELQYQSGKQFETIVEAFDQGTPPQVGQAKLILRIIDVGNNPPIITVNPVSDVVGDMILLPEGARIGTVVAHVNIDDKDQGPNGDVLCSCLHEYFSVHKLEGRGYIVQVKKPLDRELVDELKVTVVCRDSGTPRLSARTKFRIKLTDENDNPPIFTKRVYETTLEENNVIDRPLIRVSAVDDDLGRNAIVHYRLKLDDQGMFKINTNTGEIVANDVFNRETISEMSFTVLAIDEGTPPMTGTAEVLVRIIDQNDNSPKFSPAALIFSVREDTRAGGEVGMLHATDADFNFNADIEYTMIVSGDSLPFVVFSNGVIRTDRELDFESQKRFTFKIIAKDKGSPPRNTTATVTVYVSDSNDHSPVIVFPTDNNNTVTIRSDIEPGTVISRVVASDSDAGENAVLSFYINSGNEQNMFHIGTKTGEIVLAKRIRIYESTEYYLSISVQDQGTTQQASEAHLTVLVDFVNSTALEMARERDLQYIIIAGVVTGVTIILSIIIVAVIIYVRRSDLQRRRGQTICVQEHGENKNVEKQLWHSVPKDEMVAPSDKTTLDEFFKEKNCEKPDGDDSYFKNKSMDHFSGQQFFTFRKVSHFEFYSSYVLYCSTCVFISGRLVISAVLSN